MSIEVVEPIRLLPFKGYEDPGLPDAIWAVSATVSGDATGGQRTIDIAFDASGANLSGRLYNIEQYEAFDSEGTLKVIRVQAENLGFPPFVLVQDWGIQMQVLSSSADVIAMVESTRQLSGVFLGRQIDTVTAAFLSSRIANSNGDVFRVGAWGYMWSPRAINAPGGPRRPIDGLFRA